MVNYTSLAATAERLIEANGRLVTFTKRDSDPADTSMPWRGGDLDNTTLSNISAVVIPLEREDRGGELVRRGDAEAYVAHNSVSGDTLDDYTFMTDGTIIWRILSVEVINPGDTRIMYQLMLER